MAHLHLEVLAYWLVNTVGYQLKSNGINSCCREIVRIGNTKKIPNSIFLTKICSTQTGTKKSEHPQSHIFVTGYLQIGLISCSSPASGFETLWSTKR